MWQAVRGRAGGRNFGPTQLPRRPETKALAAPTLTTWQTLGEAVLRASQPPQNRDLTVTWQLSTGVGFSKISTRTAGQTWQLRCKHTQGSLHDYSLAILRPAQDRALGASTRYISCHCHEYTF